MLHSERLRRGLFYGRLGLVYGLTVWLAVVIFHPAGLLLVRRPIVLTADERPVAPPINAISGTPVRIVIPSENIDVKVVPGYYDASTNSWTLADRQAQFAVLSSLPNNLAGDTYIYGHNTRTVFGAMSQRTPSAGASALVYTSNGHILDYSFDQAASVNPTDVMALAYQGPSVLTIQTCTGSLNEWRTLYRFNFTEVVQ